MVAAQVHRAYRPGRRRCFHQPDESVHYVFDPTERAQLFSAAVDDDVAVLQGRYDHLYHHALIHRVGADAVGVEYAGNACVDVVFTVVCPVQRFGGALAFAEDVVRRAAVTRLACRIAVSDAVDVSCRGEDHPRMFAAGCLERVYGTQHAHAERLHRERFVVAYARRRREVVYLVAADAEAVDDVVVYIPEQGML